MPDNIDHYLPEFNEEEVRSDLSSWTKEDLLEEVIRAYKYKRLAGKMADEYSNKLDRVMEILNEPSALRSMPRIPGPDELRRMTGE